MQNSWGWGVGCFKYYGICHQTQGCENKILLQQVSSHCRWYRSLQCLCFHIFITTNGVPSNRQTAVSKTTSLQAVFWCHYSSDDLSSSRQVSLLLPKQTTLREELHGSAGHSISEPPSCSFLLSY